MDTRRGDEGPGEGDRAPVEGDGGGSAGAESDRGVPQDDPALRHPPYRAHEPPLAYRNERHGEWGVRGFFKAIFRRFREHDVSGKAAKLAYFAFLSLPPAVIVVFSLTGLFGGPEAAQQITSRLQGALPRESAWMVEGFVNQVVRQEVPGIFSIGLLLALWASSNVFADLGHELDGAYHLPHGRPWYRQRPLAIGVMALFAVLFLLGSVALLSGPAVADRIDLWGTARTVWNVAQWALPFLFIVAAFWIAYRLLPSRDQSGEFPRLLVGAVIGAVLWLAATAGFRLYVSEFGNYSETYGLLGAIIVLLTWIWLSGIAVLLGGEVAAELSARRRE